MVFLEVFINIYYLPVLIPFFLSIFLSWNKFNRTIWANKYLHNYTKWNARTLSLLNKSYSQQLLQDILCARGILTFATCSLLYLSCNFLSNISPLFRTIFHIFFLTLSFGSYFSRHPSPIMLHIILIKILVFFKYYLIDFVNSQTCSSYHTSEPSIHFALVFTPLHS